MVFGGTAFKFIFELFITNQCQIKVDICSQISNILKLS